MITFISNAIFVIKNAIDDLDKTHYVSYIGISDTKQSLFLLLLHRNDVSEQL